MEITSPCEVWRITTSLSLSTTALTFDGSCTMFQKSCAMFRASSTPVIYKEWSSCSDTPSRISPPSVLAKELYVSHKLWGRPPLARFASKRLPSRIRGTSRDHQASSCSLPSIGHHRLTYHAFYARFAATLPSYYDFTTALRALCHRFVEFAVGGKVMEGKQKARLGCRAWEKLDVVAVSQ